MLAHYLKVSSSLPVLYRNILEIDNEKATDGGIADAIPVREACRCGATDITVIRSRSAGYVKKHSRLAAAIFSLYFRKYPRLVEKFRKRAENYNASVEFIHSPPEGVRITEIAPPDNTAIGRTTKNETPLRAAYETGIDYGNKFIKTSQLK
jgi:predicted patatin/cPLA2 family phospholipase